MKDFDIMLGLLMLLNFVKFAHVVHIAKVVIKATKTLVSAAVKNNYLSILCYVLCDLCVCISDKCVLEFDF